MVQMNSSHTGESSETRRLTHSLGYGEALSALDHRTGGDISSIVVRVYRHRLGKTDAHVEWRQH